MKVLSVSPGGTVNLGRDLNAEQQTAPSLLPALENLCPWKKGPFCFSGIKVEGEWNSDLKFRRLPELDLSQKDILDIGCQNGYFSLRFLTENPHKVVGIDPSPRMKRVFDFYNQYYPELFTQHNLKFYPHDLNQYFHQFSTERFDLIYCLGVLYHLTDPVECLRTIFRLLKKGGALVLENQIIAGERDRCLIPRGKYCGAGGVWAVWEKPALVNLIRRSGFSKIYEVSDVEVSAAEQSAKKKWCEIKSLEDFIDPMDPSRTVEGYPRPRRVIHLVQK